MGWFGDSQQVEYALSIVGADRDESGRYLICGEPPFVGLDGGMVLSDRVEYLIGGRRANLAGLMNSTSYGVRNVMVF